MYDGWGQKTNLKSYDDKTFLFYPGKNINEFLENESIITSEQGLNLFSLFKLFWLIKSSFYL